MLSPVNAFNYDSGFHAESEPTPVCSRFSKSLNTAPQRPVFCWRSGHNSFPPHVFLVGCLPLRVGVKDRRAVTSVLGTALRELTASLVSALCVPPELGQGVRSWAASFLSWGTGSGGEEQERRPVKVAPVAKHWLMRARTRVPSKHCLQRKNLKTISVSIRKDGELHCGAEYSTAVKRHESNYL